MARTEKPQIDGVDVAGPIEWPGGSGRLDARGVVYAIFARRGDDEVCLYVGQTKLTIRERLRAHWKEGRIVRDALRAMREDGVSIEIWWWQCARLGDAFERLDHREQMAILTLKPALNAVLYVQTDRGLRRKRARR